MKEKIKAEDIKRFNRDGGIYTVLLIATVVSAAPLFLLMDMVGIIIWFCLFAVTFYFSHRVKSRRKPTMSRPIEKSSLLMKENGWMKSKKPVKKESGFIRKFLW